MRHACPFLSFWRCTYNLGSQYVVVDRPAPEVSGEAPVLFARGLTSSKRWLLRQTSGDSGFCFTYTGLSMPLVVNNAKLNSCISPIPYYSYSNLKIRPYRKGGIVSRLIVHPHNRKPGKNGWCCFGDTPYICYPCMLHLICSLHWLQVGTCMVGLSSSSVGSIVKS